MCQNYRIRQILITIPKKCLRSDVDIDIDLPKYLFKKPYSNLITIVRPEKDYGPVMKYIGGYKHLTDNSLVFVCDDDQEYRSDLVSTLVNRYNRIEYNKENTVICTRRYRFISTDTVWGVYSLLLPFRLIKKIRCNILRSSRYIKQCCQMVDDNWVSIILKHLNVKIVNMNMDKSDIFYKPEKVSSDSLHQNTDRISKIIKCTHAIDQSNIYPIITGIVFIIFVLAVIVNYYYTQYL
uniref:Uncharacterized protein n=1 Tax=Pithovirus LCPAC302 TaxID=2506593 RepID=A0A481Z8Y6_9VIRU|nr:MAG: hypothetical protein LCPAC302_02200 [Pithovirus LCPAC302]